MRHLWRILRGKETSQLSIRELNEFAMKFSTMFTFTYRPNFYHKLGKIESKIQCCDLG